MAYYSITADGGDSMQSPRVLRVPQLTRSTTVDQIQRTTGRKVWGPGEVLATTHRHNEAGWLCIFRNEKFKILFQISLKFVPNGPNYNIPALV